MPRPAGGSGGLCACTAGGNGGAAAAGGAGGGLGRVHSMSAAVMSPYLGPPAGLKQFMARWPTTPHRVHATLYTAPNVIPRPPPPAPLMSSASPPSPPPPSPSAPAGRRLPARAARSPSTFMGSSSCPSDCRTRRMERLMRPAALSTASTFTNTVWPAATTSSTLAPGMVDAWELCSRPSLAAEWGMGDGVGCASRTRCRRRVCARTSGSPPATRRRQTPPVALHTRGRPGAAR